MSRSSQAKKTGDSAAGLEQAASRNSRSTSSGNAKQEGGRFGRNRASSSGGQAGDRHLSKQLHLPDSIDALDSTLDVIYGQPGQPATGSAASTRAMMAMHSGPYDAASSHRNRNPASKHAPVGAFTSGLGVVDPITGTVISGYGRDDGPYAAVARSPPPLQTKSQLPSQDSAYSPVRSPTRENPPAIGSSTTDSFGTPARGPVFGPGSSTSNEMKARHHEVMFGVQEGEAYEDFAVGGVVPLDNDRRVSLNDAASRSAMAPNRAPSFPPQRMTDMAGTGKGSTFGQGPLRIVDPKDDREDLVNGMNGLGLYGGSQSPGLAAGPTGGLGSSTFLEGSSVAPSRSRDGGSPEYYRNGKGCDSRDLSAEQPVLNRRPSDQSANKGVRRNKSLVKRLKGMRDNPNTPYQQSDSEPEDNSLKPPSSSYPYDQRPAPGARSFSAGSGGVKPARSSSQNQTRASPVPSDGDRASSQTRARSKSFANPSFQPLGKTRSNAMSAEKDSSIASDEADPSKSPRPSLLSRVTSGRWRRKS